MSERIKPTVQNEGMTAVNMLSNIDLSNWEVKRDPYRGSTLYSFVTDQSLKSGKVEIRLDYKAEWKNREEEPKMIFGVKARSEGGLVIFDYTFSEGSDEYRRLDALGMRILRYEEQQKKIAEDKRREQLKGELFKSNKPTS